MVDNFIRQSGGTMAIESESDRGTTVRLALPLASAEQLSTLERVVEVVLPGGHETILHVDDDPWFRRTTAELLNDPGYSAIQADSGQKALNILDEGRQIDLVVTDIVMPSAIGGAISFAGCIRPARYRQFIFRLIRKWSSRASRISIGRFLSCTSRLAVMSWPAPSVGFSTSIERDVGLGPPNKVD
jgi:hypothetical protein